MVLGCVALLGFGAIFIASFMIVGTRSTWMNDGFEFALYFVLFLATVSVLPAQYANDCRLKTGVVRNEDIAVADGCVPLTMIYGIVSMAFVSAGVGLECQNRAYEFLAATVATTFVVLSLMFNLFFLLLDLKVSLLLLDQLHLLAGTRMLTMEKFSSVRAEIQRRVTASRLACDFILLPSVASIIGIVISVFLLDHTTQQGDSDDDEDYDIRMEGYIGLIFIQLKELFYVAFAFWYVAKVNGRADELTLKLSETVWGDYQSINNVIDKSDHVEKCQEQRMEQVVNDMQRVSVYMSANSRPISFTLLFKRVTWKTVILSVIGFGVTLLVGIVKSIVTQAAT